MIICISNSNIQAKKGCYRDNRLHAEEQTGTTTAQEWQRLFLQARGYETQAALKPSLITKLKPDTPQEHMGFIKSTCFVWTLILSSLSNSIYLFLMEKPSCSLGSSL